eukprot:TRINITY_DN4352_c0_g1_i1.p1 TRINITY_DN4352_c0_g1~~TRINITY_DN4352_c0_g1_i1.p1  ORF type:complete len:665 (+),score=105.66 TRINITY_DN4352_c0_g1_i1:121-1995(+)
MASDAAAAAGACEGRASSSTAEASEPTLAPLVDWAQLEEVAMRQIPPGLIDFVARCVRGRFEGRFFHLNRSAKGEIFGCGGDDAGDVTMRIANAGLSPRHARIHLDADSVQYFLSDLGSQDGTWVLSRWNRSVQLAVGQELRAGSTVLEVREGPRIAPDAEVRQWLQAYRLPHLAQKLEEQGVKSMDNLRAHRGELLEMVADSIAEAEDSAILTTAIQELDDMFPPGEHPNSMLRIVVRGAQGAEEDARQVCDVGWAGAELILGRPADTDNSGPEALPVVLVDGWETAGEVLTIGYSFGAYFVHLSKPRPFEVPERVWIRLLPDQRHWLRPGDIFEIGSLEFEALRFNVGVSEDQGQRPTMEDRHICLQDTAYSNWQCCSLFAIYDGHGGRDCVEYVKNHLHMNLGTSLSNRDGLDKSTNVFRDIYECLEVSFLNTDANFLSLVKNKFVSSESGSAAVMAFIFGGMLWCANLGDSRAVLCRDAKAVQLSSDHKPDRQDERERIEAAGGSIQWGRVLGVLALSRAFGDVTYKAEPLVIARPEIRGLPLTQQDEFLLMACDGVFDVFSSQEAVDFVRQHLASMPPGEQDPNLTAKALVHEAINVRGSRDNVSALVVCFKRAVKIKS